MNISDKVFELLEKKGMSQKEFAELTKIAPSTISDWKKKRTNPTSEKILAICSALDVTPGELLSGTAPDNYRCKDSTVYAISTDSEESMLLEGFQQLDRDARDRLLQYASYLLANHKN